MWVFLQRSALVLQLGWHSREKALKCQECHDKELRLECFTWGTHLPREPQRSHTSKKRFFCGECGKAFSCHSPLRVPLTHHRTASTSVAPSRRPSAAARCSACTAE
ncbi:hypothetical protein NN561_014373 [Cricetulus griseus]